MKAQLDLIGPGPPPELRPAPDRSEPLVWISRLCILRALDAAPEHIVRDIRLRRGLNIIWAPPAASEGTSLFRPGLAGHTAGKTTFCRFLRHVLGEPHFAAEPVTRSIRERIPEGWIVAVVFIGGVRWAVARPFAIGAHSFACRDTDVEDAVAGEVARVEYRTFLDALSQATVSELPARRFPGTGAPLDWPHMLPWLTRDQECHFAQFHEWRDASTRSDSPTLGADDRHFLLRSCLGLISDAEAQEQGRHAVLLADRRTAQQEVPYLQRQAATDHQRLQTALGIDVPSPGSDLFGSVVSEDLERRRRDVAARMRQAAARDRRGPARDAFERTVAAATNAARDAEELVGRLALEEGTIEHLQGAARSESSRSVLASLPPSRDFCQVPLTVARERGCPLAEAGVADLTIQIASRSIADDISHHSRIVAELQTMMARSRDELQSAEQARAVARRALEDAQADYDTEREAVLAAQAELQRVQWLAEAAEKAARESETQAERVAALDGEIAASQQKQEALRQASEAALRHASGRFAYVVRAILGDDVEASLRAPGRELGLHVERDGERESAALGTVRVLAFDLGALTASIEGIGHHPRFLVHDCPRESDLAPDIYERLFLLARHLEECCGGESAFQYIVTTTTPPPIGFQAHPWLRLQLAGTPGADRLLAMDL